MTPNELNQVDAIVTKAVRHEVGQLRNEIQTAITELHEVKGRVYQLSATAEDLGARMNNVETRISSLEAAGRHHSNQLMVLSETAKSTMQATARDSVMASSHQFQMQELQNALGRIEADLAARAQRDSISTEALTKSKTAITRTAAAQALGVVLLIVANAVTFAWQEYRFSQRPAPAPTQVQQR